MIRVISGTAGGLKLQTLPSDNTKPTLDRVKEAVFSMLREYIYGATVLDLFGGSGALGIEALSRGAEKCFFNDKSKDCCTCIKNNLKHTHLSDKAEVSCLDYTEALSTYRKKGTKFDIILLDPPYKQGFYEEVIELVQKMNLVSDYCIILCEHSAEDTLPESIGNFNCIKEKKYGTVCVTLYDNEILEE